MNTSAKALLFAVIAVSSAAAIGTGLANLLNTPEPQIVQLERVVIVGKRAEAAVPTAQRITQLPRVVVVGRSAAAASIQLASAGPATAAL